MAPEYGIRAPGYRLPDATRVGRVRLQVSDLGRSVAYYTDVVGLTVVQRDAASASLGAGGSDRVLVELHERRGVRPMPLQARFGLYHFALLVPDRADLGRFLAHLSEMDVRVASADHLVSEALYLWDADGLGIEVYADRPRSSWRVRENEVAMTTEPLDLRSLLRAAQEGRSKLSWNGLPAGTIVGHVHLHVGSLQRSEALYHAALGLDKVVWSFPGALFLAAGGYHHHLGTNTWVERPMPSGEGEAQLLEWRLVLPAADDIAAAADSLIAHGYNPSEDGADRVVHDDWGTRLRLTMEP
jgi:catechol 2,3-dioxygenase